MPVAAMSTTAAALLVALAVRTIRPWLLVRARLLLGPRLLRRTRLLWSLLLLLIGAPFPAIRAISTFAALLPVAALLEATLLLAVAMLVA
ncbi:MAG TPA: hypothetical protein VJT77_11145, partial [Burkholderiales bacterium]|nr:hypothetical protein [Burkholderiales bacterium]